MRYYFWLKNYLFYEDAKTNEIVNYFHEYNYYSSVIENIHANRRTLFVRINIVVNAFADICVILEVVTISPLMLIL